MSEPALPAFARGLCDDAAVFPPGSMSLPEAVRAHERHTRSAYSEFVGPLVLAATVLGDLGPLLGAEPLDLAVTVPAGPEGIAQVRAATTELPVRLRALEVVVPPELSASGLITALEAACAGLTEVEVFVEVPRDERRPEIIRALARARCKAKFRTGGVKAELYPDEAELAAAIGAVVEADVPFKATAGLHHALRNTDPETGFEQHGFLNVLLAVDAALEGAQEDELAALLAERDGAVVAARIAGLGQVRAEAARARFVSFGTCSINDPLTELVELDLVPAALVSTTGRGVTA